MGSYWGEQQRPELYGGIVIRMGVELERSGFKGHGDSETS